MKEQIIDHYHCCASCCHFRIQAENNGKKVTMCSRLGFETKPDYRFNCWDPKPRVREAMEKKLKNRGIIE